MKDDNSAKIEKWEKFRESTKDNIRYAEGRFDILIISLSSGGLILNLNVYKALSEMNVCLCSTFTLKLSLFFYLLAILSNLISQVVSASSNKAISKYAAQKIKQYEDDTNQADIKLKTKSDNLERWNTFLNRFSLLMFVFGILFFVIFAFNKL